MVYLPVKMKQLKVIQLLCSSKFWKWIAMLFVFGVVCIIGLIFFANKAAVWAGEGKLFDKVSEMKIEAESQRVALVFGCSEKIGRSDNLYFKYRIEAAARLWDSGMIRGFIVSGDNGHENYNEPADMKRALIKKGVPADKIICDYAGFRTLDSVVRLKKVFDVTEVIFISQKFHNERAAYIAEGEGINFIGLNAKDVSGNAGAKTNLRERLARVKMLLDSVISTSPKYLGKKEELGF